eukprot:1826832-Pleurochrysis_carterae.AAC.1
MRACVRAWLCVQVSSWAKAYKSDLPRDAIAEKAKKQRAFRQRQRSRDLAIIAEHVSRREMQEQQARSSADLKSFQTHLQAISSSLTRLC